MIGLLWVFFEKAGLTIFSVLATFWYASLLGPTSYGHVAVVLGITLFISSILENLQRASLISVDKNIESVFSCSLVGWLFVSIICGLLCFICIFFIYGDEYAHLAVIAALYLPLSSVSRVFVVELLRGQQFKSLALRAIAGKIVGVIVGLVIALYGFAAIALILQSVIDIFVALIVMLYIRSKDNEYYIPLSLHGFRLDLFFRLFVEGLPTGVKGLEVSSKNHGIVPFVGLLLGPTSAGFLALALKFVDLPRLFVSNGFSGWAIGKFRSIKENRQELSRVYYIAFKWLYLVLAPSYIGLAAISESLMLNFFDESWLPTSDLITSLALIYLISGFFTFVQPLQIIFIRAKRNMYLNLLSVVVLFGFVWGFSPVFGDYVIVYGYLVSLVIVFFRCFSELDLMVGFGFFSHIKMSIIYLLSSCLMYFAITILDFYLLWFEVFVGVFLYVLVLVFMVFLTGDVKDLKEIKDI